MDFVKRRTQKKTAKKRLPIWIIGSFSLTILAVFLIVYYLLLFKEVGRTNFVLIGEGLTLISLERQKNTLLIISVPNNLYSSPKGEGDLALSSLYKLDRLRGSKGAFFRNSLREFFGVPVDGWIETNWEGDLTSLRPFSFPKSSFSPFYLTKLFLNLKRIRPDKITLVDLSNSQIFTKENLPDGSPVLRTDSTSLDNFLSGKFSEWRIVEENLSIAVLNGTKAFGIATRGARIINNIGGKVIITEENKEKEVSCFINVAQKNRQKYTVSRLAQIFSCEIKENLPDDARSDIIITLGANYEREVGN